MITLRGVLTMSVARRMVSTMAIGVVGSVPQAIVERAGEVTAEHKTLEEVVRWGLAQTPPRIVCDVVVQDEYTHDVVLPFESSCYLIYDST